MFGPMQWNNNATSIIYLNKKVKYFSKFFDEYYKLLKN